MFVENLLPKAQRRLVRMPETARLRDAARALGETRDGLVVICDTSGLMAGVVSKTDVVRRICNCSGHACLVAVSDAMTRNVIACHPDEALHDVWDRVSSHRLQNIPVVDAERRPMGVLGAPDLLEGLLSETEHEEELLKAYVAGIGYR